MKHLKDLRGFTLIELVMVIVILAILGAVAIPKYYKLQDDAKDAATDGVVSGVRSAIGIYHAHALVNDATGEDTWPDALDSASPGTDAGVGNPFFVSVFDYPITADWKKKSTAFVYEGPNKAVFTYVETGDEKGSFNQTSP